MNRRAENGQFLPHNSHQVEMYSIFSSNYSLCIDIYSTLAVTHSHDYHKITLNILQLYRDWPHSKPTWIRDIFKPQPLLVLALACCCWAFALEEAVSMKLKQLHWIAERKTSGYPFGTSKYTLCTQWKNVWHSGQRAQMHWSKKAWSHFFALCYSIKEGFMWREGLCNIPSWMNTSLSSCKIVLCEFSLILANCPSYLDY